MSQQDFTFRPDHPMEPPAFAFHSHVFPDGDGIKGFKALETLTLEADVIMKHGMAGKTVLDIGAWDGFFSFEAERRGAARVLATDHFVWTGVATRKGFEYAYRKFDSKVDVAVVDVPDLDPAVLGTFDVVLFLGVLYHLKDPLRCLEKAAAMSKDLVVCETEVALDRIDEPIMRYFLGGEMANDPTNFWAPNTLCLERMFRDLGFTRFEVVDHPLGPRNGERGRIMMFAWRT